MEEQYDFTTKLLFRLCNYDCQYGVNYLVLTNVWEFRLKQLF